MGRFCALDPSGAATSAFTRHLTDAALRCAFRLITRSHGGGGVVSTHAVVSLWLSAGTQEGTRGAANE